MHRYLQHGRIIFCIVLFVPAFAAAQMTVTQQPATEVRGDFQVGPTRFVLEMSPGEERVVEVELTSREGAPRQYNVSVEDFAVTDDGTDNIQFFAHDNGPFPGRSWIQPSVSSLALQHGERAVIPVKISVPKNASAGDHYAVVLFERQVSAGEQAGSRVGALCLITIRGDLIRDGQLQTFTGLRNVYWTLPAQFSIQYRNTGMVHLVPVGHIAIKNIFGMTVDDIAIQDWYVLRNSTRDRDMLWQPTFAFGRYTATLTLNSAGQKSEDVRTVSFWVMPTLPVLFVLLTVLSVAYILQAFWSRHALRGKHKHRKRTVRKSV